MDYARFNYIAQPGDKNVRFIRQMGPYDHYATNWGYRVIPNAISRGRGAYTRPVDYGKTGNIIYKYGNKAVVLTLLHKQKILEIIQ
jgi:hypothetical protein